MNRALELGHKVLAFTEHETISNSILIEEEYEKIKNKNPDFKVIRGNEIYLVRNGLNKDNYIPGVDSYTHFILLALDEIGHKQIREISTRAWLRSYMQRGMRRVPTYYQDLIRSHGRCRKGDDTMSHSFHYLIMAEHSIFQKELLNRLKDTGLTIGQPKVLDYLKDHDGAGQKDIARGCHIEPGTLTTILNRMEDAGLVERRMLNGNRRSLYVFLTEKGKEQLKLVTEAFSWMEKEAFRGISETERKTFMDLMLRVYENISSRKD